MKLTIEIELNSTESTTDFLQESADFLRHIESYRLNTLTRTINMPTFTAWKTNPRYCYHCHKVTGTKNKKCVDCDMEKPDGDRK